MKLTKLFSCLIMLVLFSCSEPNVNADGASVEIPAISKTQEETAQTDLSEDVESKEIEAPLAPEIEEGKEKPEVVKKESEKIEKSSSSKKKEKNTSDSKTSPKSKQSSSGRGIMAFKETTYDFGVITQGDKIEHKFVFENTGDGDLEIMKVDATCGCTTPTFPFLPISPGEKGVISVAYDSTGKLGNQKPMITIVSNAKPRTHKIYLKGVVDAKRAEEKIEEEKEIEN